MRNEFLQLLLERSRTEDFLFLTGDVGFGLLEPLQEALGERFINCGVAEQNMVSVAAGLAHTGWEVWVYTIAPFCYARAFEQIRNDLCFHQLPVKLLGSGGGYAYGVLGPTHHALEDYGTLCSLPKLRYLAPASTAELSLILNLALETDGPCYLRLENGSTLTPKGAQSNRGWTQWSEGTGASVVTCGPLLGELYRTFERTGFLDQVSLWSVHDLPLTELPSAILEGIEGRFLMVVEEHARGGSLASQLSLALLERGCKPAGFEARFANGYSDRHYGCQSFHRRETGLDGASVLGRLTEILCRELRWARL